LRYNLMHPNGRWAAISAYHWIWCCQRSPTRSGILGSLTTLLMAYYVFDLKIPPHHTASVFQTIILEEPIATKLPQNCLFFIKKSPLCSRAAAWRCS